jgi:hypothetical protein
VSPSLLRGTGRSGLISNAGARFEASETISAAFASPPSPSAEPKRAIARRNGFVSQKGASRVQRDGIQKRGWGMIPAFVLYLTKLVEGPKERPLKARLVAGELAEGVALVGVGVECASEEDLVTVPLVFRLSKRLLRFRVRGLSVISVGKESRSSRFKRSSKASASAWAPRPGRRPSRRG